MPKLMLVLLFVCTGSYYAAAQKQPITIWYTPIKMPAYEWDPYYYNFAPEILAKDAAALLQSSTGINFTTAPYNGTASSGIMLLIDGSKTKLANEAAEVNSDGSTYIKITGRFATGVSYALYTYLQKLGFRFYLPGNNWTVTPALSNIFIGKINTAIWQPHFKVRNFFLSAAMHRVKNLDEEGNNFKQWNTWYRRNRMGSEYIVMGGHIGEAFNMSNKAEIEKDSLILAPVEGKRKYDVYGKLNPTYDKAVNLFTDWIIEQYKNDKKNIPSYIPVRKYQSVDPGDGLNYCHSPECKAKFKSISDQVFYVANKAAVKIKKDHPEAGVNLYAYSERADIPTQKLEDNIHVCVVASAFQDVGTHISLINKWAAKTPHVSLYDYINIPVWGKDQPFFNLDAYFKYLDFIKRSKLEGITFEAGGSSMAAGVIQYFILKYMSEPYTNVQAEFDVFCKDMFGSAAPAVKQLLQQWFFSEDKLGMRYENVTYTDAELGSFVQLIKKAYASPGLTQAQQQRLFELKAFTVHLANYYELRGDIEMLYKNKSNPVYIKNKAEDVLRYTWMLYPTMLFHNTQLNDVIKFAIADEAMIKKWDFAYGDVYKNITANAVATVETAFKNIDAKYSSRATPVFEKATDIIAKAYPYRADTVVLNMIDAAAFINYRYPVRVYCGGATNITIKYKATLSKSLPAGVKNIGFLSLIKDDYTVNDEKFIYPTQTQGTIVLRAPTAGYYFLYFAQHNITEYEYTVIPGKALLYINNSVIPCNGLQVMENADVKSATNKKLAFYTGNVSQLNYGMIYADYGNYTNIYNNKGQLKKITDNNAPYSLIVPLSEQEKNTFMYFTTSVYRWPPYFKNIAPYYFFLKFPLQAKK
jgi:hypothetical protein